MKLSSSVALRPLCLFLVLGFVGRGWGKTQELLFLSSVSINGFGAVSLGFPGKAINVAISTINLHGGELYMATKDGMMAHRVKVNNGTVSIFAGNSSDAQTSVNISCEPNENPLRRKNVDIGGTKYMIYCAPLDIAGLPSVSIMVRPVKGLVGEIQRHSKTSLVLLIVLLISLVMTVSSFIFLVIKTARREMFLCAALIKQMEATQQAERKNLNKSLAFASASHDVRSSLASLDGIITLCSAEVSPNSEIYSNLENMRILSADLIGLLNSVLDTSKIEAGKMELNEQDFSLAQVLEETVNLYYPVAKEKSIDLVLDPCDGSVVNHSPVKGDRGKLKQVLSNLLHNAIKFTSDGHIVVRCWVKNSNPENSLQAAQQHQNCDEFVIEMDDTGRGIPKEKQKSVFEDFVQVNETTFEHGGTGLGLGIVQSLVRLMGGDIEIIDKDLGERGTCFRFNIFLLACGTTMTIVGDEENDSKLLVNRKLMKSNPMLELSIRNQSQQQEGSHVMLFMQGVERGRILQRFLESLGVKVSTIDRLESLIRTLERIKDKCHLAHLSSSRKSDLSALSDCLSTPTSRDFDLRTKDLCLSVKDGTDYPLALPLHKKTSSKSTLSFLLIIIDFSATAFADDQFLELYSVLESFKKDIIDFRYKVIWLYTPKTDIERRRLDEKRLANCELIVSKPLHGSRLYELLKLLPEFGGAQTIQRYRFKFTEENAPGSSISKPHSQHENRGIVQIGDDNMMSGINVLVVEDEPILCMVARRIMEDLGATVSYCRNGEEAVRHVCITLQESQEKSSRFPYDFILMDCQMPTMDGYEATRQIRLEEKLYNVRIPIIALTANGENEEQSKRVSAGMDITITKPLNSEKLVEVLHFVEKYYGVV